MPDWLRDVIDIVFHLDRHLGEWSQALGAWLYVILFLIVFCETGLVVAPFLPGDSLFFALGALAAQPGSGISVPLLWVLLVTASITGNTVNYLIGRKYGPRIFHSESSRFLNREHLVRAQRYYEKHGGKTMVFAQFLAFVRTFAPFVAGMGRMAPARFAFFTVTGAVLWVTTFLGAGYWFGERLQGHFHWIVIGIILFAVVPVMIHRRSAAKEKAREAAAAAAAAATLADAETTGSGASPR